MNTPLFNAFFLVHDSAKSEIWIVEFPCTIIIYCTESEYKRAKDNFKVKGYNLLHNVVLINNYFLRSILVSYQYEIYRTTVRENCSVLYYYECTQCEI